MSEPVNGMHPEVLERLVVLLAALGDPPVTPAELASLAIVARLEPTTVENLAAVIRRARGAGAELVDAGDASAVWWPVCRCGHARSEHGPFSVCGSGECGCLEFTEAWGAEL